ncbi:thiol methyltransferase-like protein [Rhexocercosporidium sp. MPI-PUGE-AT-0058]|nr:thiol methyltransferase-like protein [Rhexocercosporidium sp. MPI-PUGE-AT-0058]
MSTDQPTDARARLLSHFTSAQGSAEHGSKWNELWTEGFLPWDKGFPNPALSDLLSQRQDLLPPPSSQQSLRKKKALVPGCGKGYDVLLLSAHGYDGYGLEISSKALEEARKVEGEMAGKGDYATREGVERGSGGVLGGEKFDLIYDYTFLSALPPVMRPAWSERFVDLLAPEGRVVCVEFPTYKPPSTGGPPFALPPKVYLAHLTRPGEELPYAEDGELLESKLGEPSKSGLVRVAHFQPERTHQIGYDADGKVTDWVSVWRHP